MSDNTSSQDAKFRPISPKIKAKEPSRKLAYLSQKQPLSSPNTSVILPQPQLEDILYFALKSGYSHVYFRVDEIPRFRNHQEKIIMSEYPEINAQTFMSWLYELLTHEQINSFETTGVLQGSYQLSFARLHLDLENTVQGLTMVVHLFSSQVLTLEELKLPEVLKSVADAQRGLIFITGLNNSGKSSTIAALIDYINKNHPQYIFTLEPRVKFIHKNQKSWLQQIQIKATPESYVKNLNIALTSKPDVIVIENIEGKESFDLLFKAIQRGHLVIASLYADSVVKTLERILSLYSAEEEEAIRTALSESIVAIISQGLCWTTDGKRAAYHDILISTEAIKDCLRQSKYEEILSLMKEGEFDGMITTNQSLLNLYQEGRITEKTARENSYDPYKISCLLKGGI